MRLLLTFHFILWSFCSMAQNDFTGNCAFLELGGNGGIFSINYETNLEKIQKSRIKFLYRTGLSFYPGDQNTGTTFVLPQSFNMLIGETHYLELGVGESFTFTTRAAFFMRAVLNVGYRFMSPEKRIFYRVTYTPFISHFWDVQMSQWAGASIGYQF